MEVPLKSFKAGKAWRYGLSDDAALQSRLYRLQVSMLV